MRQKRLVTCVAHATITFVLNLYALFSILAAVNIASTTCEQDRRRYDTVDFGLDQLRTLGGGAVCSDPNPVSIQADVNVNWFEITEEICNLPTVTCTLKADATEFLTGDPITPDPAVFDYINYDATYTATESAYQCFATNPLEHFALILFYFIAAFTGMLYLLEIVLIFCSYDFNAGHFGKSRFRFNEYLGWYTIRFFTAIPVICIAVAYVVGLYIAFYQCNYVVENCPCELIPSVGDRGNSLTIQFKEGAFHRDVCPLSESHCDGITSQYLQSSLFALIIFMGGVHGKITHHITVLKHATIEHLEFKKNAMSYGVLDFSWPFLHVKDNHTTVAEVQELARKYNVDEQSHKTFYTQALEKARCNVQVAIDGLPHLFVSILSATIRCILNLYAAYITIVAANEAAHTCPEQRQRLQQSPPLSLDRLRVVSQTRNSGSALQGGCEDSPAVQTAPVNWFLINADTCLNFGWGHSSECHDELFDGFCSTTPSQIDAAGYHHNCDALSEDPLGTFFPGTYA
jgi:hypothetical protein